MWQQKLVSAFALTALPIVWRTLQAYHGDGEVQGYAAHALAKLVDGNCYATGILRAQGQHFSDLIKNAMLKLTDRGSLDRLAKVLYSVHGANGLLEFLSMESLRGPRKQAALLKALASHDAEGDVDTLLRFDAIKVLCAAMPWAAADGIAALGRVVEFMLQHIASGHPLASGEATCAAIQESVFRGVSAILERFQSEMAARTPCIAVYSEALRALRNLSNRSAEVKQRICACETLKSAVEMAFEKDYYALDGNTIRLLLGTISLFSGTQRLMALLDRYPEDWTCHEACEKK